MRQNVSCESDTLPLSRAQDNGSRPFRVHNQAKLPPVVSTAISTENYTPWCPFNVQIYRWRRTQHKAETLTKAWGCRWEARNVARFFQEVGQLPRAPLFASHLVFEARAHDKEATAQTTLNEIHMAYQPLAEPGRHSGVSSIGPPEIEQYTELLPSSSASHKCHPEGGGDMLPHQTRITSAQMQEKAVHAQLSPYLVRYQSLARVRRSSEPP